jgi:hypothetical protein
LRTSLRQYVRWLHSSLGDIPPVEYEQKWALGELTVEPAGRDAVPGMRTTRRLSVVAHEPARRPPSHP